MEFRPEKYNTLSVKRSQCPVKYQKAMKGQSIQPTYPGISTSGTHRQERN